ncbi:MAG: hypothetical protein ACU843_18345 [Gammaproteobacteria bacterium]
MQGDTRIFVILETLRARLGPIIDGKIIARNENLITSIRQVINNGNTANPYGGGGSRTALALERVFKTELAEQCQLIWCIIEENIGVLNRYKPLDLADALKHYVHERMESSRVELARDLKQRSGPQSVENETFKNRFEMRERFEELLREYYGKIDLRRDQRQAELRQNFIARIKNFGLWILRLGF